MPLTYTLKIVKIANFVIIFYHSRKYKELKRKMGKFLKTKTTKNFLSS